MNGVVTVHFNDHDNTQLAGSGKFTCSAYKHSDKVANIVKT